MAGIDASGRSATDDSEPMSADGLAELVNAASLVDITFLEISARRVEGHEPDDDVIPVTPEFEARVQVLEDDGGVAIRYHLILSLSLILGEARVHCVATYALPDGFPTPARRLLNEYANNVAVMTMVPYVRQALHDVTAKTLPSPILMPIMRRNDLAFSWDGDSDVE